MSAKAIYEAKGKELLNVQLAGVTVPNQFVSVNESTDWESLVAANPWLSQKKLIVKPDQLIKRRGKLGLIKINATLSEVRQWTLEKLTQDLEIGRSKGRLKNFIVEPFIPHSDNEESYVCIYSSRSSDTILFYHQGGVDIGDVESKALSLEVQVGEPRPNAKQITDSLLVHLSDDKKGIVSKFIERLYAAYCNLYFTYMEINPIVVNGGQIYILDLAAKLDQCAEYLCKGVWGEVEFPTPFGRDAFPEEAYIQDLDSKSGASLKLTILNREGRIWTMVAGGGASVIYADTICDMGGTAELANYGEYSGAPSEQQTYEYAKTLLSLMTTSSKHNNGKVLIIGGGIANFTNVAATFKGIVKALRQYQQSLQEHKVKIYVRRAGPNYQEGLRVMRELGQTLGIPLYVFGPETHMTAIVAMALGKRTVPQPHDSQSHMEAKFLLPDASNQTVSKSPPSSQKEWMAEKERESGGGAAAFLSKTTSLFDNHTKAIVWGMQNRAVQGMLDFDHVCSRNSPSVLAMTYPLIGDHKQKFYWGHKEILIPIYKKMDDAMKKHPESSVLVNFASLRSAYESTMEALKYPQIKCIAIIAEGIPENKTREIIKEANAKGVSIIGPATVGGIKPGCFKIGNTGGMMDNILSSKLYRSGSVAYVSRSGGMSNELNNIISHNADGVYEGVAIGGDRYPGTTFMDHVMRYEADENIKLIVVLGEVGGTEELRICEAIKDGRISKPIVCWCIGTCAKMFNSDVQFGHAGASANGDSETAVYKNRALKLAGAHVPNSFDDLGELIRSVYQSLLQSGVIVEKPEVTPPTVPMDYNWARELGLIRKPASFMTSICDERGQELLYAGIPITEIFQDDLGLGGVLGLLWFQRRLPRYATKFIEMILMVTADHGPAVSGAHNTIVCARAGKDLVSSLTSGLLTIGDRFGGALDGAARQFSEAFDAGLIPMDFVNDMRKKGQLIMGIGHRVKSINNPDKRVQILKDYVKKNFPSTPLLDYALEVEKITTSKKPNLILNVDGFVAISMVDFLRNSGLFTREEAAEFIDIGVLNGMFVLGRSMGFIGHYLDQRRLKQGLYRHPWDDISYVMPESNNGDNSI